MALIFRASSIIYLAVNNVKATDKLKAYTLVSIQIVVTIIMFTRGLHYRVQLYVRLVVPIG